MMNWRLLNKCFTEIKSTSIKMSVETHPIIYAVCVQFNLVFDENCFIHFHIGSNVKI